jgi:hypothetical protein
MQRAVTGGASTYFRAMNERCRAKAAEHHEDKAYWLGLAQIWAMLAERDEEKLSTDRRSLISAP